jgi:methyl acetate hydrolase
VLGIETFYEIIGRAAKDSYRNQIGDLTLRPLPSVMPELKVSGAVTPGRMDKFGPGFALNSKAIENGRGVNTTSWSGIRCTYFWIDSEKKICTVLLSQMLSSGDPGALKMLEEFDRAVYALRFYP